MYFLFQWQIGKPNLFGQLKLQSTETQKDFYLQSWCGIKDQTAGTIQFDLNLYHPEIAVFACGSERVNHLPNIYQTLPGFHDPRKEDLRKLWGKRRQCWKLASSTFPTMFSTLVENFWQVLSNSNSSSVNSFSLKESKVCHWSFGRGFDIAVWQKVTLPQIDTCNKILGEFWNYSPANDVGVHKSQSIKHT